MRIRRPWAVAFTQVAFLFAACTDETAESPDGGLDDARVTEDAGARDATVGDVGSGRDAQTVADASFVPDGGTPPGVGRIDGAFRLDHFGWRPDARKVARLADAPRVRVELRRVADGTVALEMTSGSLETDEDSGDRSAAVDFSGVTEPGDYYLYVPSLDTRSYEFKIAEDVYDIVGLAAVKAYYYQRCNHDRSLPFAGDALGGYSGIGGRWVDAACHASDEHAMAGPGSPDHGPLDVRGGWHDAGDYQKTLWGRGVSELLFAYELNPTVWSDAQLNIPESGNGIPDILDEARWELDFYVRMQRPDGHFMTSAKGHEGSVQSPPSASNEERVYFDVTAPSGDGWSGGGTTIVEATGNGVMALAHAAVVFRAVSQGALADSYAAAARSGWAWLDGHPGSTNSERHARLGAAAAVYRLDSTVVSAKRVVESFGWSTWDGGLGDGATPNQSTLATAAWQVLLSTGVAANTVAAIKEAVASVVVEGAFAEEGPYGGMFGGPGNGWDWSWGSNRAQSYYGANLLMAAHFGILGGHSVSEVNALAEKHFHFMTGLNALNMVFLTNMAAYGGEHSSFQIYHAWFSYTGGDGDNGNSDYNGKPRSVEEPLYPYHVGDEQVSTYGPAPGFVPGGPNFYYGCGYDLPSRNDPAKAYRDFSVGCDWDGSQCRACGWEITEPMQAYQGPFVLLTSFLMSR